KTRLLRELALNAKLTGATVLQTYPEGAEHGSRSLARALFGELRGKLPNAIALDPHRAALAWLEPAEVHDKAAQPENALEQRMRAQHALCSLLLAQSAEHPILLAIDELEACDDESIALLVALCGEPARKQLALAFTLPEASPNERAGLAILRARVTHRGKL